MQQWLGHLPVFAEEEYEISSNSALRARAQIAPRLSACYVGRFSGCKKERKMEIRLALKFVHTAFVTAIVSLLSGAEAARAQSWNINGNTGTNPANNFLGTQDSQPLIIKTFGILSLSKLLV
jgi:hypothetical protein